jgi:hypothetical protein
MKTQWIEWNSDRCPIPWALAGEFKIQTDSSHDTLIRATEYSWAHIKRFCLTNGWIYCDGKTCPIHDGPPSRFIIRFRGGTEVFLATEPKNLSWTHVGGCADIVAVKLIDTDVLDTVLHTALLKSVTIIKNTDSAAIAAAWRPESRIIDVPIEIARKLLK